MIGTVTDFVAEAVFASSLQPSQPVTAAEAWAAITAAVARYGAQGCVELLALEYGERPETAAPRMRFARELADALAPTPALAG
ncbi:hypothetical protein ACFO1B_04005 [Dactylosporangium siamense]|uniref:Uncharacterized protein n=1 Tax=Dactylosporangium siamense TaxID=685454 RepID=A0A919PEZ0_9ACTN|nr:hypothetical protein [Dactylosporangium siamense]GIG42952.1 hypothetical protein Dsi01nite_009930 [Dactylosporangium siamense]